MLNEWMQAPGYPKNRSECGKRHSWFGFHARSREQERTIRVLFIEKWFLFLAQTYSRLPAGQQQRTLLVHPSALVFK